MALATCAGELTLCSVMDNPSLDGDELATHAPARVFRAVVAPLGSSLKNLQLEANGGTL
jgi:hypothetical protein